MEWGAWSWSDGFQVRISMGFSVVKNSNKTHRGFGRFFFKRLGVWAFLFWGWFEVFVGCDDFVFIRLVERRVSFMEIQDMRMDLDVEYIVCVVVETFFFQNCIQITRTYGVQSIKRESQAFLYINWVVIVLFLTNMFVNRIRAHVFAIILGTTTTTTTTTTNNQQQTTGRVGPLLDLSMPGHQSDGPGLCISNQWGHSRCIVPGILHQATWSGWGEHRAVTICYNLLPNAWRFVATGSVLHPSIQRPCLQNWGDFWNFRKNVTSIQGNLHLGDETSEKMVRKCSIDRWLWLVFW